MRLAYGSPEHQPGGHDDGRGDAGLGEPGDERAAGGSRPCGRRHGQHFAGYHKHVGRDNLNDNQIRHRRATGVLLVADRRLQGAAPQPASGSGSGSGSGSDSGATTSDSTTPTQAPTAIVIFVFVGGQQSSQTPLLQRFDPSTVQDPALRALLAHPNPEQSAETRLFLPTDERSLVLKAAETADNTSQPSLLTKLETVSEPQLRLSSSEAVEGNSAGGVQLSGSPAANVVLIVVAGNSQPATLQLGGDPNSPFTLPMSESAAADQRLMNFGLLFAQDFSQSGWATRPVVLPPEPQLTAPEQAFRNNFLAALDRGDTLGESGSSRDTFARWANTRNSPSGITNRPSRLSWKERSTGPPMRCRSCLVVPSSSSPLRPLDNRKRGSSLADCCLRDLLAALPIRVTRTGRRQSSPLVAASPMRSS